MAPRFDDVSANCPRLMPEGNPVRRLVVLLHGVASDASQLFRLAQDWRRLLPDTAFVAPNGPQPCPDADGSRQWFPLPSFEPAVRRAGVAAAAPALDAWLNQERDRHQLRDSDIALVGFSQGALMALAVGLRRSRPIAAIVSFSGILVDADQPEAGRLPGDIASRPPVLLVHGADDTVIPPKALELTARVLTAAGVPHQGQVLKGVGHAPGARGVISAGRFLARAFGLPERPPSRRQAI